LPVKLEAEWAFWRKRLFFFAVIETPDCPANILVSIKTTLPHNITIRPIAEHC